MVKHYIYNDETFKLQDKEGNEYTLTIMYDFDPEDPRNWSNLCTMICWHNRYNLGDKHVFDNEWEFLQDLCEDLLGLKYEDCEDMSEEEMLQKLADSGEIVIKSINLYDHSGITVSTSSGYPYNDRWDAGGVGYIYVTKKKIFNECGNITEENWKECADKCIEAEMQTYDDYVQGNVYGYRLTQTVVEQDKCPHCGEVIREYECEEEIDSCFGFYGDSLEDSGILDNIGIDLTFVKE